MIKDNCHRKGNICLSIIIVNFRTFDLTSKCIESILQHLLEIEYEIILVDNAPIESQELALKQRFPYIVYLHTSRNIGFGQANNLGIEKANGKYLLLINSDTLVFDDSLHRCYEFMEKDIEEKIGALGCKLLNEDKSYQASFFPFKRNNLKNYLLANNWLLSKIFNINDRFGETDQIKEVGDISGAFMLLRKQTIDSVLAFDPDFFLYCEETEWCRERISKRYKIIYFPLAAIIHYGSKSAPKEPMFIQAKLSLFLLWYKKGMLHYILFILLAYSNAFFHAFLYPFLRKQSRRIIKADIKAFLKVYPYLFTEITKYERTWGSRNEPLIYEGARSVFFGDVAIPS